MAYRTVLYSRVNVWAVGRTPAHAAQRDQRASDRDIVRYSTVWNLRNQEIETETLIFAPISLSYIEID